MAEGTARSAAGRRVAACRESAARRVAVPVKLVAFACVLVASLAVGSPGASGLLSLCALAYLAAQRRWRLVLGGAVLVAVLGALLALIRFRGLHMVVFSEFYVLMFWNLSPVFLVACDLVTTPPGELSSFLSRIHVPTAVVLGVLVVFRFFPTMRAALAAVGESMRNRGLCDAGQIVRHPLRTCEYVAVPLLMRCMQVADQLSVSAVARGAEAPGVRGSYGTRPLGAIDAAWGAFWLVLGAALLAFGGVR